MITAEEARKIAQDSEEDNKTAFKFIGNLNNAIEKEAARGFLKSVSVLSLMISFLVL